MVISRLIELLLVFCGFVLTDKVYFSLISSLPESTGFLYVTRPHPVSPIVDILHFSVTFVTIDELA